MTAGVGLPLFGDELTRLQKMPGMGNVRVPSLPDGAKAWRTQSGAAGTILGVDIPIAVLEENLQENRPAAPSFLVCIAWWLGRDRELGPRSCLVRVRGTGSRDKESHRRRSLFLLSEYARLLGSFFEVDLPAGVAWTWPSQPLLNVAGNRTRNGIPQAGSEAELERWFIQDRWVLAHVGQDAQVRPLQRQLPIGLFDGAVEEDRRWTPGRKSAVDAWTTTEDGSQLHIFELKRPKNVKLGMLPEALYYALLLSRVRARSLDVQLTGEGPVLDAIGKTERIIVWLAARQFHPLLGTSGRSPLELFNRALSAERIELRFLPIPAHMGPQTPAASRSTSS